ncbi:MAG TPA: acyclic terpene utilization AtuA family protein [Burkholderiales bacterium]|nr:acyclic terpene utilization AtuA family protein [Burkholderiales bacterium]
MSNEVRMLSASGILGYGYPEASLKAGLERKPHMIGVDGGSSDPGPHYLGSGSSFTSSLAIRRDMRLLLHGAIANRIPMMIGTCGGAGGEPHLQRCTEILHEIAREDRLSFKLAVIHSVQDKAYLKSRLAAGKIKPLGPAPALDEAIIDRAERVVGMMGPEPYARALDAGAQVILAGRSTDPAPWAALALHLGMAPGPSWYAGKLLECACNAALPKAHDCLFVTVRGDSVECEPTNPALRCTPLSVAVQALHENASPVIHREPGGQLDATGCEIRAVSDRATRVSGMRWTPQTYTIKLEGAEKVGYSAITFAGTRDPGLVESIDAFLHSVRASIAMKIATFDVRPGDYQLVFRLYGKNGVMGDWEPKRESASHEIGVLAEVIAQSQEIANAVVAVTRASLLHTDFAGRMCKEGNMAFPFSPSDIERGPIYRFSLRHVVEPDDPYEMFPIEYETV